jgi:hypothetical protein
MKTQLCRLLNWFLHLKSLLKHKHGLQLVLLGMR